MQLICTPARQTNYIWLLKLPGASEAIIIDPGEAKPVFKQLKINSLRPVAIFLTHHHHDHTDGVGEIQSAYPDLSIYGPDETSHFNTYTIKAGDIIKISAACFSIFAFPGHTLGHIGYYSDPFLFCGDTLFSAGCGKIFEGSAVQLYLSLQKITQLPTNTLICCGHEYTLNNLHFAINLFPENTIFRQYYRKTTQLRQNNLATVPTTLATEKEINLFLQCDQLALSKKFEIPFSSTSALQIFTKLRELKDQYNP